MKNTVQFSSIILLAILVLMGCSEKKKADNEGTGKGLASPEEVFKSMKESENPGSVAPYSVSLYAPEEQYMLAYQTAAFARFTVAMIQDEAGRKNAERGFEELIEKYELADRLEFSDNEDKIGELAVQAFEGIDLVGFIADASEFMTTHEPSETESESVSGEAEEIELLSMKDLKIDDDEATATLLHSDDTEERTAFVRVDGGWFLSLTGTLDLENETTIGLTLKITFNSAADLEKATAKGLLEGVEYDRSMAPELTRKPENQEAYLEFMVPEGFDHDQIQAQVGKASGVKAVVGSMGMEFEESIDSMVSPAGPMDSKTTLLIAFDSRQDLEEATAESLLYGGPLLEDETMESLEKDELSLQAWLVLSKEGFGRYDDDRSTEGEIAKIPGVKNVWDCSGRSHDRVLRITFDNKTAQDEATVDSILEGVPFRVAGESARIVGFSAAELTKDPSSLQAMLGYSTGRYDPLGDLENIRAKKGVQDARYDFNLLLSPTPWREGAVTPTSPGETPGDPEVDPAGPDAGPITWTSNEGKSIDGWFMGIEGDAVQVRLTGKEAEIPFDRLSPESLARAKAAWKARQLDDPEADPTTLVGGLVEWTSNDGKSIEAGFMGIEGEEVRLTLPSKEENSSLPFDRLSPESLDRAKAASRVRMAEIPEPAGQ